MNDVKKNKLKKRAGSTALSVFRFVLFLLLTFVVIYPVFTKFATAFMTAEDIHDLSVHYIPKHFTMNNFVNAWKKMGLTKVYPYTVFFCGLFAVLQMAVATTVGYGIARFRFALAKPLMVVVIIGLLIPPDLLLISLYSMFTDFDITGLYRSIKGVPLSLIDTFWPIGLLSVTGTANRCGIYILLMRQYFRGMPKELEEAAYIDGAGPGRAFLRVMVPSSGTMMVTVGLFSFVWTWLDNTYSSMLMPEIPTINHVIGKVTALNTGGDVTDTVSRSLMTNAAALYVMIPLVILYAFTQKFFVQSVERSGLVG